MKVKIPIAQTFSAAEKNDPVCPLNANIRMGCCFNQLLKEIKPGSNKGKLYRNQNVHWVGSALTPRGGNGDGKGAGVNSPNRSHVVSVWFQLTLGTTFFFFLLRACAKVELPWQLAFRVIGTDGHQTHRAEIDTLRAADLGEIEQLGSDRKPS